MNRRYVDTGHTCAHNAGHTWALFECIYHHDCGVCRTCAEAQDKLASTILVCGGRDYNNVEAIMRTLESLPNTARPRVLVHGGARGADSLAGYCGEKCGYTVRVYPADWKTHGRAAGPIRNQLMLDTEKPDLVVAFPGGRGTADMIARAEKAGIPVIRFGGES